MKIITEEISSKKKVIYAAISIALAGTLVLGLAPVAAFADYEPPSYQFTTTVWVPAETKVVHHDAVYKTVHHDAEYETVHHAAEYKKIPYRVCKACGGDLSEFTHEQLIAHQDAHLDKGEYNCGWYSNSLKFILVKEAYDEQVLASDAYDEQVLVTGAYDETVVVKEGYWKTVTTTVPSTPAIGDDQQQDLSGLYTIGSGLAGGKVVDIAGGSTASGANAQMYFDNTTAAQRYNISRGSDGYYTITNVKSGKVLDVSGGVAASGANVQQYTANGTDAQKWSIFDNGNGALIILSKLIGANGQQLVLDVAGASASAGANLQLYAWNGTKAQQWSLNVIAPLLPNSTFFFKCVASGKALDIAGANKGNFVNAQQYEFNNTLAQKFNLTYDTESGYYTITNANSGKVLDVSGGKDANGTNVQQYESNNTDAQKWTILANEDGSVTIRSSVGGKALDVSGASLKNGANVQVWDCNNTAAQKWSLK